MRSPTARVREHFDLLDTGRTLPDDRTPAREESELPLAFFLAFVIAMLFTITFAMLAATHSF